MSDLQPSERINEILRGIDGIVDSAHQAERTNPAARYDELLKQHGYTGIHDYLQKAGKPDALDRVESSTIRDYLDGTITPQTLVEQMSTNDHMVDLFSAVSQFINTDSTDEEPPQPADTQRPSTPTWAEDDGDFSDETWLEDGL
ncbi:hypothetical protein [Saccharopolyspora hordei]|uniref:Uncharacterized protein n=1 Tax=Saccharopolyspora hordei TaxID=1838 RepID=A0A853AG76_9PSEU|nr:hypothetical protein [Saccharopolyspora hordei]NYI82099.1 hypothetical protein [Saccharopolyspora hordei]